jgi:hypothetical protein
MRVFYFIFRRACARSSDYVLIPQFSLYLSRARAAIVYVAFVFLNSATRISEKPIAHI